MILSLSYQSNEAAMKINGMKNKNKFNVGDKVESCLHECILTIKGFKYNGLTYMYDFEETNMRCGESYLTLINHA